MKKLFSRMSAQLLVGVAAYALVLGETVTAFSVPNLWPYEPEMPEIMKAKLMD
jgi:hypothetical protein